MKEKKIALSAVLCVFALILPIVWFLFLFFGLPFLLSKPKEIEEMTPELKEYLENTFSVTIPENATLFKGICFTDTRDPSAFIVLDVPVDPDLTQNGKELFTLLEMKKEEYGAAGFHSSSNPYRIGIEYYDEIGGDMEWIVSKINETHKKTVEALFSDGQVRIRFYAERPGPIPIAHSE